MTRSDRFETRSERRRRGATASALRTWGPDQRIDRKQALRMVTIAAARFISEEQLLGSIEPGKYADLVVLNGDYLAVPDEELDRLQPVMTVVGGEVVFEDSRSTN